MPKLSPRPLVYLDHWAHSDISSNAALRARMLRVLQRGTLLFSFLNWLEVARTSATTLERIASFLDDVGKHWAPITLSATVVDRAQRARILEPWRADYFETFLRAPRVAGKLSNLVRMAHEPWVGDVLKKWEQEEAADIGKMISVARQRVRDRDLKLDGTADVPDVLDAHGMFATVIQRYACGSLTTERNQVDDLLHTIIPAAYADVVFLDGPTKRELLKGLNTRARVFCRGELEKAFQYLEGFSSHPIQ